jgi:hypothetical protein
MRNRPDQLSQSAIKWNNGFNRMPQARIDSFGYTFQMAMPLIVFRSALDI